jgi:sugar transferase (PEP-CTERM system associated)
MATVRFFRHSTQLFRHYVPTEFIFLALIEFLLLILALRLGLETRYLGNDWQKSFGPFLPKALLYVAVMQLSLISLGVYQRQIGRFRDVLVLRIAAGLLLGLIPLGASFYLAPGFFLGRGVIALAVGYSFIFIAIVRIVSRRFINAHDLWTRILVLGSGESASLIREARDSGELIGLKIVGFVRMPCEQGLHTRPDQVELIESLVDYVEKNRIDEIVLAVDDRRAGLPSSELLECKMSGVEIMDLVTFFERRTGKIRLDLIYPSWLYLSEGFRDSQIRRFTKRTLDVVFALLLLPLALPLMVLTGLLIFLEGRGREKILYLQTRVSQDGRAFRIYKFRSMVADAERDGVPLWASANDRRVTPAGRWIRKARLDELPQLFNVLKGDMSFVGPRPERPEFVAQLADKIPFYNERHRVKPGLTGWAQIRYPYASSEEDAREKLQYDLYYVKNYSILLDVLILLQTAEVVMLGRGAQ